MLDRPTKYETSPFPKSRIGSIGNSELIVFIHVIIRNWKMIACLCIAATAAATWEHYRFPVYRAKTTIYFQSADTSPLQALTAKLSGESAASSAATDFPEKYLQHLLSYPFALEVATALKSSPEFQKINQNIFFRRQNFMDWTADFIYLRAFSIHRGKSQAEFTVDDIAEAIQYWITYARSESSGVTLSINTPEPELTLLLANIASETAAHSITQRNLKELNDAGDYLKTEIDHTEAKLTEAESSIVEYKKNNKLISIDQGANQELIRLETTKQAVMETDYEIDESNQLLQKLDQDLKAKEKLYALSGNEGNQFGLGKKVSDERERLKILEARRSALKNSLSSMMRDQNPHSEQKIYDLKKHMELEYSHFQDLEHQSFQVELQRIAAVNKISISAPVRPNNIVRAVSLTKKITVSLFISILFGITFCRIQEFFSPVVRSREDLEALGIALLAAIPTFKTSKKGARLREKFTSQTFKHIRTRLLHLGGLGDRKVQIVAVLSPSLGDGKSYISKNLASSFAEMGKRTLLIDLGLSLKHGGPGLMEVLRGTDSFARCCISDITSNLDLLPGGNISDDLSLLLNGRSMSQLMEDLRALYSYVIIETLPSSVSVDCALFSAFCDISVVVAVSNKTLSYDIERLTDLLSDSEQKPIVGILNRFSGKSALLQSIEQKPFRVIGAEANS